MPQASGTHNPPGHFREEDFFKLYSLTSKDIITLATDLYLYEKDEAVKMFLTKYTFEDELDGLLEPAAPETEIEAAVETETPDYFADVDTGAPAEEEPEEAACVEEAAAVQYFEEAATAIEEPAAIEEPVKPTIRMKFTEVPTPKQEPAVQAEPEPEPLVEESAQWTDFPPKPAEEDYETFAEGIIEHSNHQEEIVEEEYEEEVEVEETVAPESLGVLPASERDAEGTVPWENEDDRKIAAETIERATPQTTAPETPAAPEIPAAVETPPAEPAQTEEYMSVDDWMDMMEGKAPPADGEAPATGPSYSQEESLEYSLKGDADYTKKHEIAQRQEKKREVEKFEATRDGLKKRGEFTGAKLEYKRSFKASAKNPARLCSTCGSREEAKKCVVCGNEGANVMARLCDKCAGDKKTAMDCIKCGRPNSRTIAKICDNCQGAYLRNCVKCGEKL